jgi:hypothetical protein
MKWVRKKEKKKKTFEVAFFDNLQTGTRKSAANAQLWRPYLTSKEGNRAECCDPREQEHARTGEIQE